MAEVVDAVKTASKVADVAKTTNEVATSVTHGVTKVTKVGKFAKATRFLGNNSPLILTVAGVIGLGATAYLSYKSAKRVNEIVEDMETAREDEEVIKDLQVKVNDYTEMSAKISLSPEQEAEFRQLKEDLESYNGHQPVDRIEIGKKLLAATAAPLITGVASILCISFSYRILSGRNGALSAALTAAVGEHAYYRKRVKENVSEDVYSRIETPIETKKVKFTDAKGKEQDAEIDEIQYRRGLTGEWFDQSGEYAGDDHSYNLQFVQHAERKLSDKLFRRGYLRLNEVYDELGYSRTQAGEALGWSVGTHPFTLESLVTNVKIMTDEGPGWQPEIFTQWSMPGSIYDQTEYDGRYSE